MRSLSGQQGGELFHRERPAEQIALGPGTAQFAQDSQLFLGLHALGNGTDAHILRMASMTSRPLFIRVAESMVIFAPMLQLGCFNASAGVTDSSC